MHVIFWSVACYNTYKEDEEPSSVTNRSLEVHVA
jgi:hypothetical protein